MKKIDDNFYLNFEKYKDETKKSVGWYIASFKLNGLDKQIALLHEEKHNQEALRYLKQATEALNG